MVVAVSPQAANCDLRLAFLEMFAAMVVGPRTASQLVEAVGMGQSAVSHQLRQLRDVGLIIGERRGRHIFYRLHEPMSPN